MDYKKLVLEYIELCGADEKFMRQIYTIMKHHCSR